MLQVYQNNLLLSSIRQMKTVSHFHTPIRVKRHHTIGSQMLLKNSNVVQQKIKERIRTVISMTSNHDWSFSPSKNSDTQNALQNLNVKAPTPRITDQYDEESQNLTAQFSADWSKMDSAKKQTYTKLRTKFVQKFPSFRQKYKKGQINENQMRQQNQAKAKQTDKNQESSLQKSFIRSSIRQSIIRVKPYNPLKKAYFYSKSKKKCLQNNVQVSLPHQISRYQQVPIPKITYLTYIKNNKQKQKLKVNRVKGQQMIKTREKILNLEKQGTQSYSSLRKCLQDAIQMCITSK